MMLLDCFIDETADLWAPLPAIKRPAKGEAHSCPEWYELQPGMSDWGTGEDGSDYLICSICGDRKETGA